MIVVLASARCYQYAVCAAEVHNEDSESFVPRMGGNRPSKLCVRGIVQFFLYLRSTARRLSPINFNPLRDPHTQISCIYTISTGRTPKYPPLGSLIGALVPEVVGVYEPGGGVTRCWTGFGPYLFEGPVAFDTARCGLLEVEMTTSLTSVGPGLYPVIHCLLCFG